MSKRKKGAGKITQSGNLPRPGQKGPATIILTQPRRFGIDIADYMLAVRAFENVDYSRRFRLYDLFSDILMDTHLTSVIEKRKNAALASSIEFRRNGKPDEKVNKQIRSPWFRKFIGDILDAKFWGFWDEYPDLLFIGSPDDPGLLVKAAIWVIYKRNDVADWAQFAEVFGAPIREYTYPTDDDEARQKALDDADSTGSLSVFVHAEDTVLKLVEAANKTGSADLYDKLCERCNNEISKLFLGNTLTTEASDKGTQALGTVHKDVEEKVTLSDRQDILDVLNYDMADIFAMLGIDTTGGEFCYPEKKLIEPEKKMSILTQLRTNFNLPVGDDYLYEEFGIEKPANYDELKKRQEEKAAEIEAAKARETEKAEEDEPDPEEEPELEKHGKGTPKEKKNALKNAYNWLKRFFGKAPGRDGAALEW